MAEIARDWKYPLPEALELVRGGQIDGDTFLRSLMHHRAWLVPGRVNPEGLAEIGVIQTAKGRILEVFTTPQTVETLERGEGDEFTGQLLRFTGWELFAKLDELAVDRLNVDPGSAATVHYKRNQLPLLADWAGQAQVEVALYDPDALSSAVEVLASWSGYHLVYERSEEGDAMVLAPDSHGRRLAAIFSSWDTADAFVRVMADEAEGPLEVIRRPASALFASLERHNLDGVVFNPLSHLPARAFHAGILGELAKRS